MDPAKLQKQLVELMKVVQEERKLSAQAEAAQKTAKTLLAQNTQTQNSQAADLAAAAVATHASKGPKIGVPDKFDGTRGVKAEVYTNQVGFYVISNRHLFPNDRSKLVFSLLYLTGQAGAWAQQFTTRVFAGKDVTYKEFSTAFQAMYFDTRRKPGQRRPCGRSSRLRQSHTTLMLSVFTPTTQDGSPAPSSVSTPRG
jgi:hypothetical protein